MKSLITNIGLALLVCSLGLRQSVRAEEPKVFAGRREIPAGPLGDTINLGRELVERTAEHRMSKPYVRNSLNCTSCHLKNGTDLKAASFIGVATAYPAWSPAKNV